MTAPRGIYLKPPSGRVVFKGARWMRRNVFGEDEVEAIKRAEKQCRIEYAFVATLFIAVELAWVSLLVWAATFVL